MRPVEDCGNRSDAADQVMDQFTAQVGCSNLDTLAGRILGPTTNVLQNEQARSSGLLTPHTLLIR